MAKVSEPRPDPISLDAEQQRWVAGFESQLLDLLPVAVVMADLSGRVKYWNGRAESLFGWSREEATGALVADLVVDPPEVQRARQVQEQVRSGEPWEGEISVRKKDGSAMAAYLWDAPLRNPFGDVVGAVGVWEDISPRRSVEEELQRTRELYRVVVENAQDLVALLEPEGRILFASASWESMTGHGPDELLGVDVFSLVHPEDRDTVQAVLAEALRAGQTFVAEFRSQHRDGRWLEIEGSGAAILDERGRPSMVLMTGRDVGQRKDADRRLAARTAVTRVLAEAATLSEAAPKILRAVCQNLGWALGAMWRVDRDAGVLRCVEVWRGSAGSSADFVKVTLATAFPPGIGLPGRVWSSKQASWIQDVVRDDNFPRAPVAARAGLHGAFGFPIALRGEVLGVIEYFSQEIREPDEDVLLLMSVIGSQIGQFMERTQAEEEVRFQKAVLEAQSEAAIDGILVVSAARRMISFNRRFVEMWGIPDDAMASRSDEAALAAVRDQVQDPDEFLARVDHLYEHPDEVGREEIRLKDGRVFDRYSAPVKSPDDGNYGRVWYFRDITERKREEETLRFLASVSELLTWSLDYRQILTRVARLVVRHLADWCIVYLTQEDGSIERVTVEHVDSSKRDFSRTLEEEFRLNPNARRGVPEVLRTGRSLFHPSATKELLSADVFQSRRQAEAIADLNVRSWICVPLSARGRIFGAISLIRCDPSSRFGESDLAIAEEMARRVALAVDNARLYQERDHIARVLQRSFIPPEPPLIPGMEVEATYLPAGHGNEVGGDFYDVFELGSGRWAVVVGDVCGKGPEAAAVMALARYTTRAAAIGERSPSRILEALNRAMIEQVADGRFVTVCLAIVERDEEGGSVTLASGGHPLPIVARADGKVESVGVAGMLLGVFPEPRLADRTVRLAEGDVLVLYTDGVIERRRPGDVFGEDRLRALLAATTNASSREVVEEIERAIAEFSPDPPRDDIAVVALRVAEENQEQGEGSAPE